MADPVYVTHGQFNAVYLPAGAQQPVVVDFSPVLIGEEGGDIETVESVDIIDLGGLMFYGIEASFTDNEVVVFVAATQDVGGNVTAAAKKTYACYVQARLSGGEGPICHFTVVVT